MLTTSLYVLSAFSMEHTSEWVKTQMSWFAPWKDRWTQWQQARAARREARQIAKKQSKTSGVERIPTPTGPVLLSRPFEQKLAENQMRPESIEIPVRVPVSSTTPARIRSMSLAATPINQRISQPYKLPSTALLLPSEGPQAHAVEDLKRMAGILISKCEEFDVHGTVTQINPGPVVTTYEFKPEAGVKYNKITNLVDDLCLALEAESILIERIPGKSTVGIEVPNPQRETIVLREIIESESFTSPRSPLTVALGKEINGRIRVAELASMPHLLIAGSTGSGKSVTINSLLISILYKATPDDVKLILVDP
ncbi:MAG: DNA translocase FtsK, partial [Acidobacteria bacterium]|nr:DNA translocase FtsK [Acidobacteriota bacterium]